MGVGLRWGGWRLKSTEALFSKSPPPPLTSKARFLFARLTPAVRREVDARRAPLWPRGSAQPPAIGMHIRKGDSCALLSRYCPKDLNATYFAAAAELRNRQSATVWVL